MDKKVELLKHYLLLKGIDDIAFKSFLKFTDLDITNTDQVDSLNSNNELLDNLIKEYNANEKAQTNAK
jgi:hypothetical protein